RRRACLAQCIDPCGDGDRIAGRRAVHRRDLDGDDLLLARRREMGDRGNLPARLSGAAGRHAADRRGGDDRQPPRRRHLRPDQPAHPVHTLSAEILDIRSTPRAGAPPHPLHEFWSYFKYNTGAVIGLGLIVALIVLAALADIIAPHSPTATNTSAFLRPPFWQEGGSLTYPLGTDAIGRDMLSRLIHGTRLSLLIGLAVVAASVLAGTTLGLIAGFFRGVTEIVILRLMDIVLTLPSLLLAIVIVAILGPGLLNAMLAVAIVILPHFVRLTRGSVI